MGKAGIVVLVAVVVLGACGGGGESASSGAASSPVSSRAGVDASPAAVGLEPLPRGAWTDLAHALVDARKLDDSVAATREILARGGIATTDGESLLVPAIGPASRLQATPQETVSLAMQARHRAYAGSLTIAELAQLLEGVGWPFPDADPDADADQLPAPIAPADATAYRAVLDAGREAARAAANDAQHAALAAEKAAREAAATADAERVQAIAARMNVAAVSQLRPATSPRKPVEMRSPSCSRS